MDGWAQHLVDQLGLAGIALLMLLETVFPPIPSEVIMPLAGISAARGTASLPGVIVAGTAGAMAGNLAWYLLARRLGAARLRPLIERHGRWLTLDWPEVERAGDRFRRHGALFVLMGRLIPTVRSIVSLPAGLFAMPSGPFLLWSTLGTMGWTALLALAGFELEQRYSQVTRYIGPVAGAVIGGVLLLYVWRLATWRR